MHAIGKTWFMCTALLAAGACTDEVNTSDTEQETASSGATAVTLARVNLGDAKVDLKWTDPHGDKIKARINEDVDLQLQQVTFVPGGHSGWHAHPGPAIISVAEGTGTLYTEDSPCEGAVYAAGTGFIEKEGGVHILRNEGTTNLRIIIQWIIPKGAAARIDAPALACP